MILTVGVILGIIAFGSLLALLLAMRQGISVRQAALYMPFRLLYRVDAGDLRAVGREARVIYAISHQSRLDPALMLSLLPDDTLHILDDHSARSPWLEPWRELTRTIAFNPEHVFVSRRLVRVLRGNGRLAVYLPPDIEPDSREFRLYRAVARIAQRAEARIMPIHIENARNLPFSLTPAEEAPRKLLPKLRVRALSPMAMPKPSASADKQPIRPSVILFDRMSEARAGDALPLDKAA